MQNNFCLIHEILLHCLDSAPKTHLLCVLVEHYFNLEASYICVSQIWLCTMWCLWGKLIKVIQPTERLSHSPATEGSMSPVLNGLRKQTALPTLLLVDALIKWTGARWRVITRVSFNRLPTIIYHYSYAYSLYCISIVTSPAAPWFTELCLRWHLLNSQGLLQTPLRLSVYVCVYACVQRGSRGKSSLAWEKGKSYSTEAPTVAKPFPIMSSFCNNNCV